MKPILFNFTDSELIEFLEKFGQPKFRAKQIREWLLRGAPDFVSMKNLPENLRRELDKNAQTLPVKIVKNLNLLTDKLPNSCWSYTITSK